MVNEALIERLEKLASLDAPENGGPYGGYAASMCIAAMRDAAAALKAAEAQGEEWKRHYDKATERLAAYSRDFAAEHKSLTAARAEIERLREGLRWIVGHDSRIDATIQSDGKDRRIVYGEFARIAVSLLGGQGK